MSKGIFTIYRDSLCNLTDCSSDLVSMVLMKYSTNPRNNVDPRINFVYVNSIVKV